MPVTHSWAVAALDRKLDDPDHPECVTAIHWRLTSDDGSNTAGAYGVAACDEPTGTYTAFADLTDAQVCGWLFDKIDKPAYEAAAEATLAELADPPADTAPPPWAE